MGLHLTTLLTGAAVGALVTYITKDEEARKSVERFIDGSIEELKTFLSRITPEKSGAGAGASAPPPKEARPTERKTVH